MTQTSETPIVSVIIPAYNAAWCVGKAIESVLTQDYRDFELIVVDDGSTDGTQAVLATYGSAIRVINQPNGGMSNARNTGIAQARGEYIAFLDADDWWLPGKLYEQVKLMCGDSELGFTSTAARVVDPDGVLLNLWPCRQSEKPFLQHLFEDNAGIAGGSSALMVRRVLLEKTGGYDETLKGAEDADLWLRLAASSKYDCVPDILVAILRRPGSVSRNVEAMRGGAIQVMYRNRHLLPNQLQTGFWRGCMAGVYGDYAKWRYRSGRRGAAIMDVVRMLVLAPIARGRLGLGLLRDMLLNRKI